MTLCTEPRGPKKLSETGPETNMKHWNRTYPAKGVWLELPCALALNPEGNRVIRDWPLGTQHGAIISFQARQEGFPDEGFEPIKVVP